MENVINRYALLHAECFEFEEKREAFFEARHKLEEDYRSKTDLEFTASKYYNLLAKMQQNIVALDKQIMAKRSMLLAIEKENILTIGSALRSIPKKKNEDEPKSGMAQFMAQRRA